MTFINHAKYPVTLAEDWNWARETIRSYTATSSHRFSIDSEGPTHVQRLNALIRLFTTLESAGYISDVQICHSPKTSRKLQWGQSCIRNSYLFEGRSNRSSNKQKYLKDSLHFYQVLVEKDCINGAKTEFSFKLIKSVALHDLPCPNQSMWEELENQLAEQQLGLQLESTHRKRKISEQDSGEKSSRSYPEDNSAKRPKKHFTLEGSNALSSRVKETLIKNLITTIQKDNYEIFVTILQNKASLLPQIIEALNNHHPDILTRFCDYLARIQMTCELNAEDNNKIADTIKSAKNILEALPVCSTVNMAETKGFAV